MARRVALALIALLPLSACGSKAPVPPPAGPAQGSGFTVALVDAPDWKAVSAEVATVDQAQILARIPGLLATLSVKAGDPVYRGEVIGRIADSQLGGQSAAYGAQAAAAQAQAAAASAELARTRFLVQNGVYAQARLDAAEAQSGVATAQVRAARAQQSAVQALAGQGALVAPASGRVLTADIPAGSPVTPGMVVATLTSGPVIVRLTVPESLVGAVHAGSAVSIDTADGGASRAGVVTKVYPAVAGGEVRIDAQVPGIDASLIGRRLAAHVAAGTRKALLVPVADVTTRFGIDYVNLRDPHGTVATVPVQTAPSTTAGRIEILAGVSPGDVLVSGAGQ